MKHSRIAAMLVAAALVAIAPRASGAQKPQQDRITRQEIEASARTHQDMYSLVRALRPHFLRPSGGSNAVPVALYVDGRRRPSVESLRAFAPERVAEVRYMDAATGASELGPNASSGVVILKLQRRAQTPEGGAGSIR